MSSRLRVSESLNNHFREKTVEQKTEIETALPASPLKTDGKPFCQIVGKYISPEQCSEMQGHEGCFGCAARTRICEDCRDAYINVPAVGLCSKCLTLQLNEEMNLELPEKGVEGSVRCQLLKSEISVEMCHATQGQDGCFNCNAPSRFCEKCEQRPSRFPQYGLCLHCSVEEYGEGWTTENSSVVAVATLESHPKFHGKKKEEKPLPIDGAEAVVKIKKRVLLPKARKLLHGKKNISVSLLAAELKIRYERAREIMVQLEAEGLVGPSKGTAPRDVLPPISNSVAKKCFEDDSRAAATSPVIRKLEQMLKLFPGGELEKILKDAIWELKKLELMREFFEKFFQR